MSYRFLDHATDAIVEVDAKDLKEAFAVAARAVIDLTIDQGTVAEKGQRQFSAGGKDLHYLLFSWLEEVVFVLITEGFAIARLELDLEEETTGGTHRIHARAYGEPLDLRRHNFKVEVKAPTFYDMQISEKDRVRMRFLLDL